MPITGATCSFDEDGKPQSLWTCWFLSQNTVKQSFSLHRSMFKSSSFSLLKQELRLTRIFKDKKPIFPDIDRDTQIPPSLSSVHPPPSPGGGAGHWAEDLRKLQECQLLECLPFLCAKCSSLCAPGHLLGKPAVPHSPRFQKMDRPLGQWEKSPFPLWLEMRLCAL